MNEPKPGRVDAVGPWLESEAVTGAYREKGEKEVVNPDDVITIPHHNGKNEELVPVRIYGTGNG